MRVTYNGPHDGVEIPSLEVVVERGESIDVLNPDLAAQLIEQACWDAAPADVLAWVGKDAARAAAMLRAEQDGAQRPEVLSKLDRIANPLAKATAQPNATTPAGAAEEKKDGGEI